MTEKKQKIIIIGGESLHVQEILDALESRNFPVKKICLLAENDRCGQINEFRQEPLLVGRIEDIPESNYDFAVLLSEIETLRDVTTKLIKAGIILLDLSGSFSPSESVPVVFNEYWDMKSNSVPSLSVIPSPVAIACGLICKPIETLSPITRITACGIQGVSQQGSRKAMDELFDQTRHLLGFKDVQIDRFPKQIAFNAFPVADPSNLENRTFREMNSFLDSGVSELNLDLFWSGFFVGLTGTIWIETASPLKKKDVEFALQAAPSVKYTGSDLPPGILDVVGKDYLIVGGLRYKKENPQSLTLRFTMDNLRKGFSTNLVQSLELFAGRNANEK